jgi:phosphomevalonate kinase
LLQACIDEAVDTGVLDEAPRSACLVDTKSFVDAHGRKLGLGSSAAAAVAFLRAIAPALDVDGLHAVAQRAHRRFQHGQGSGVDIAASVYGGLVHFRRHSDVADDVSASPLTLRLDDVGVAALVVWSGRSQDTRAFLPAVTKSHDAESATPALLAMADATRAFLSSLSALRGGGVLAAVEQGHAALKDLGAAAGIDIISEPHAAIAHVARRHGGTAKPSGAGGGDVALAMCEASEASALTSALVDAGYPVLPIRLGASGAMVQRLDHDVDVGG